MSTQNAPLNAFAIESPRALPRATLWLAIGLTEKVCAALLLAAVSPLLTAAALFLMGLSRRGPLIAHKRVGRFGQTVWVLKLRTMWDNQPAGPYRWIERISSDTLFFGPKKANDSRIKSRFAALCRRFSIDELPQLWSVVTGDMALVGPRPLTAREITQHYGPSASELLSRKPGITGLWQVSGRSVLTYRQRRRLDLFMLRNWRPALYIRILCATVPRVITGKNAW